MAAKFFTGLPLDGPDPECVKGHSEEALMDNPSRKSGPLSGIGSQEWRPCPGYDFTRNSCAFLR
jgi:hypothetical protein